MSKFFIANDVSLLSLNAASTEARLKAALARVLGGITDPHQLDILDRNVRKLAKLPALAVGAAGDELEYVRREMAGAAAALYSLASAAGEEAQTAINEAVMDGVDFAIDALITVARKALL